RGDGGAWPEAAHGALRDARARDAGLAASRRRGRANQAPARAVGQARRRLRAVASGEGVKTYVALCPLQQLWLFVALPGEPTSGVKVTTTVRLPPGQPTASK